jgi:hypothetical protein
MKKISVFSPKSVSSVALKAWYRADSPNVSLAGSVVSQWNDLSGNGYHLTQSTTDNKPTYEAAGFNGQPSILFDGVNDYLQNTGTLGNDVFGGDDKAQTVYIVFEATSIPAGVNSALMVAGNTGSTANYHWFGISPTGNFSVLRQDPVIGQTSLNLSGFSANKKYIYRQFFTGTSNTARLNIGNTLTGSMNNNALTLNTFAVGSWIATSVIQPGPFRIAEIIIYNGQPNSTEDYLLSNYFQNRYQIFSTNAPVNIGSAGLKAWFRSDQGITLSSGNVSQWNDLSGYGYDFTQGTSGKRPVYTAIDSSYVGNPSLTFDGSDDFLSSAVPVGNSSFIIMILKQITWGSQKFISNGVDNSTCVIYQFSGSVSPNITMYNGTAVNTNSNAPLGTVRRLAAWFSNSTSDYLQIGSSKVTGANAGNSAAAATYNLGGATSGTNNANFSIAELIIYNALPSNSDLTLLDNYLYIRYGSGILT